MISKGIVLAGELTRALGSTSDADDLRRIDEYQVF
jgi:hypothetical protein